MILTMNKEYGKLVCSSTNNPTMGSVLVIGDSCRDIFVYCSCNRLAPEFPVQVLDAKYEVDNGGMAKNVQINIESLGGTCDIITNDAWENNKKTRYIDTDTNYMFIRVDTDNSSGRFNSARQDIDWSNYDAVIISDYDKGFLHEHDIENICNSHECVFIDTKKPLGVWAKSAKFIKINHQEFLNSKSIIEADKSLYSKIIRTMGPHGAYYRDQQFKVDRVDVKDVSGAGDSFLAGLVVEYIKTGDIGRSIIFGNECATTVVQKRGVSTV